MGNPRYFGQRVLLLPVTWLGISALVFALLQLAPGGPEEQKLAEWRAFSPHGEDYASQRAVIEHQLGLDRPLTVRYASWLAGIVRGDWGTSLRYGVPVRELIAQRATVSFAIGLAALALAFTGGSALGIGLALTRGSPWDRPLTLCLLALHALPSFVVALVLWRLTIGAPFVSAVLATALALIAGIAVITRHAVLDQLSRGYATAARARGLSEWRIATRHAWRHAAIPLAGALGATCSYYLAGSVVIETVFDLRGLGQLAFDATLARDYPVLLALVLALASVHLVASLLGDWLLTRFDPRLELGSST